MSHLVQKVQEANSSLIRKIDEVLVNGDRRKLPLWMERSLRIPLDAVTADMLEGMKAALGYVNWKIEEVGSEIDRSKSLVHNRQVVMRMKSRDLEEVEDEGNR